MTNREKVLAEIDLELQGSFSDSWHEGARALRAIVELHTPNDEYVDDVTVCSECYRDFWFGGEHYEYGKYPCKTIQAIEKELGR